MVGKLSLLLTMLFACAVTAAAQAFTYSYIDPCTGKKQYVAVNEPNGSITMSYNKFIKTFRIEDFNSGAFDAWLIEIKNAIPGNNPCGGVGVELTTETNTLIAMNTVTVTTTVVTAVASAVMSGASDIVGGAADVTSAGDAANSSSNVDGEDGGEGGSGSSGGKDGKKSSTKKKDGKGGEKKEGEGDGGGSGGDGSGGGEGTGEGGGEKKDGETPQSSGKEDGEKSDGQGGGESGGEEGGGGELSGGSSSANSSSKQKSANVRKGNLIATGDIVAIQNQTTDNQQQFRINASMIYSDSKKILAYGGLLNFTTAINNSSLTGFVSYRMKKLTGVLANSTMINFEKDLFNTTSLIAMYPIWKIGLMAGGNATYGMFGTSSFTSYSALAGANGTIPMGKLNLNLMLVGLYSPYTFYYEGMWYKTNIILVPFASVDYAVTKTFKFNISFSSVYEVQNNVLNYQVLLGGKYLF
jgi:hypothetical protein